mmetsp:Transcript_3785/g.8463  ORF Transcript_3785/g.8463 Transcript_3785/m.8463 type:complete len:99 (+) Transcript_3785:1669-1965(+)
MGNMRNLNVLTLSLCGLTGTLLPEIGDLSNLLVINFKSNDLTGTIPEEFANLSRLGSLNLEGNYLSGTVPTSLCSGEVIRKIRVGCHVACDCCQECSI